MEDLARFASLQLRDGPAGGSQILKGTTLREMHRVQWLSPDWQRGWGLGFRIQHTPERDLIAHGGALAGYRTVVSISPKEKIGVIVLTNADDVAPHAGISGVAAQRIFQWVVPAVGQGGRASAQAQGGRSHLAGLRRQIPQHVGGY